AGRILRRQCACGNSPTNCSHCGSKAEEKLRRSAFSSAPRDRAPAVVNEVLDSPGRPLESATRALMEPWFGRDFSDVRVHTDSRAAQSARAVTRWPTAWDVMWYSAK